MGGEQHVGGSAAGGTLLEGRVGVVVGADRPPAGRAPDGASRDRTGDLLLANLPFVEDYLAREHPGGESEDPTAPPVAGGAV